MKKKTALGNIGFRFKVVLGLLAALTIVSYGIQEFYIIGQDSNATEINVAGRQRMLTQRISLLVSRLAPVEVSGIAESQELRRNLSKAVELMATSHLALSRGDPKIGIKPPRSKTMKAMYFGPEMSVDRDMRAFLDLARPLLNDQLTAWDLAGYKKSFFAFDNDQLLSDLNAIVERYELENKEKFRNLSIYQTLSLVSILIALLISWFMVFQPLVRQLNKYIGTIFQQGTNLRGSEERFKSITDSSILAMIVAVDQSGDIISWNPAAERIFGYKAEEVIGQPSSMLFPERHQAAHEESFGRAKAGDAPELFGQAIEAIGITKEGMEFPIEISMGSWQQSGKKFFSAIIHDITPRVEAERALKASAHRLEQAQKVAHMIHWEWDIEADKVVTNAEGILLLGRDPNVGEPTPKWFFENIFAPDKDAFRDIIVHGLKTGETIQLEYRFVRNKETGELCWLHMDCAFEMSKEGKAVKMLGTARDATKEKRLESTLIAAKEEAELADRAKTTFLANMSHELRTPLNAIIGFSDIIRNELLGPMGSDVYKNYATDINNSGNHLLSIISDILDVSKLESGKMDFHEEAVDLAEVVEACQIIVEQRARDNELALKVEVAKSFPRIRGDGLRLKQITLNLLTNSIKFTPPGGKVGLTVQQADNGDAQLIFSDTGVGIDENDMDLVMRPFFQSGDMTNSPQEGNGLGLFIAKSLTELHDGTLELKSEVGLGTTVTVAIPAARLMEANIPENMHLA